MTRFLDKSFSVYSGSGQNYRDNWDAIFGKKTEKAPADEPEPHGHWEQHPHAEGRYVDVWVSDPPPPPSSTVPSR